MARLLMFGMLAGLFAAVLAFAVAWLGGEPAIEAAIAIEEQASGGHAHGAGEETDGHSHAHGSGEDGGGIGRGTQSGIGLFTGLAVFGVALGGVFAIVYSLVQNRLSFQPAATTIRLIGLLGFVSVVLVPMLKYPGTPPAVGDPETIGTRTVMYFLFLALSLAALGLGVAVGRQMADLRRAVLVGGATYLAAMALAFVILPSFPVAGDAFPRDLLWRFWIANAAIHATLWAGISLAFGWLIRTRPFAA